MNNSWYELKQIAIEKNKANNYKGTELAKAKLLKKKKKTNHKIITTFNETSMTPENQRNLISSVILIVLYTSVYFICILLSFNYCFKILCSNTVYYFIHFTVIILYSWMILFSYRKEMQNNKDLETQ